MLSCRNDLRIRVPRSLALTHLYLLSLPEMQGRAFSKASPDWGNFLHSKCNCLNSPSLAFSLNILDKWTPGEEKKVNADSSSMLLRASPTKLPGSFLCIILQIWFTVHFFPSPWHKQSPPSSGNSDLHFLWSSECYSNFNHPVLSVGLILCVVFRHVNKLACLLLLSTYFQFLPVEGQRKAFHSPCKGKG